MATCDYPEFPSTASLDNSASPDPDYENACSVWKWCPCSLSDVGYCAVSSSCPMPDVNDGITGSCTGDGTWYHVCGDETLGPPCIWGEYFGQVMFICKCPTEASLSSRSDDAGLKPDSECSIAGWPFPFTFHKGVQAADPADDDYVPTILYEGKFTSESKSMWTWCPCEDEEGEPDYPEFSASCPQIIDDCTEFNGDGYWVFRGGSTDYGPPPLQGRFYGETVFVGYCCGSLSSLSYSESSLSLSSLSTSCSMPGYPYFDWNLNYIPSDYNNDITESAVCDIDSFCGSWIWCQCQPAEDDECREVFDAYDPDNCPWMQIGPVNYTPGWWEALSGQDHHGAPPFGGRFYGEVVYYCECDDI